MGDLRRRQPVMEAEESPSRPSISDAGARLLDNNRWEGDKPMFVAAGPRHWARNKWFLCTTPVLVVALITIPVLWSTLRRGDTLPPEGESPPWYPAPLGGTLNEWNQSYTKAREMVKDMSLVEKVNITTGTGWATNLCVGNTGSANNAGFPMLCLQDGPLGIRFADNATLWPAGITTAATWNKNLIYQRGRSLANEHRRKGVNILLGPAMGALGRMPAGGRNWESFGPDPVLAGIASAETIRGIQDEGVMATAKHLVGNEQEHFRQEGDEWGVPHALSSNIDDRTMHELYMWPFQDSVRAGVASVMCSYNMVNSSYACQNSKLINGILKDELGFQGFVQSDWLAQRSGVASALSGLDMSMPGDGYRWADGKPFWGQNLTQAVLNGSVPIQRLDDMVTRIVASWHQLGQDNTTTWPKPKRGEDARPNFSSFTDDEMGSLHPETDEQEKVVVNRFVDVQGVGKGPAKDHSLLAQQVAAEGHVLVKNVNNVLPINQHGLSGGSQPALGAKIKVGVYGEDAGPVPDPKWPNQCIDRACNAGTLGVGWGSGAAEFPFLKTPIQGLEKALNKTTVDLTSSLTNDVKGIPDLSKMDLCFAFANADAGEGFHTWQGFNDRKDLHIQKGGNNLVKTVAKTCKNTVVIIHAVGPVIVEAWADHPNVKAIILAQLPGEMSGYALTDILLGVRDASGRLPYTVGKSLLDYGPGGEIMRKPSPKTAPQQLFKEGLLIDYRHFDHEDIEPRYPFGFGLSYTTWSLTNLKITTLKPKSPFPDSRPEPETTPPSYPTAIPDISSTHFPSGFRTLFRYIYSYMPSDYAIDMAPYPYPSAYTTPQRPSPAGGGQGGNPSLFEPHISVSVTVKNDGTRSGMTVVQLYLAFPDEEIAMPKRVLRQFEKVECDPGEEKELVLTLDRRDLSYWDIITGNWRMPNGQFAIQVGWHSRELVLNGTW